MQPHRSLEEDEEKKETEAPIKNVRDMTIYPEPLLSKDQVKQGGFILYIAGKLHFMK